MMAMTIPVRTKVEPSRGSIDGPAPFNFTLSFYIPLEEAPEPSNDDVFLEYEPAQTYYIRWGEPRRGMSYL